MTSEIKILLGVGAATLVLIFGAIFLLGGSSSNQLQPVDQKLLVREDSDKISTPSAKVTIVEFGDYQCPACGAAEPVVEQLLNNYKGKINFVFRNFAFIGQESTWAAEAAECAGDQNKFWQYHNYIYSHQGGENKGAFSKDNLKKFANILALNDTQFGLCLDTDKYSQKISNDSSDGQQLGINSTPTFFINGEKEIGVLTYDSFKSKIESKIKQSSRSTN